MASRIQISKTARDGLRGARCICVCNHVGELYKHIPRLFPKQGNLLQSQLRTRMTVINWDQWFPTVIRSVIQSPWTTNYMATAWNVGTADWIFFINFAHRVKAHNNICLVYTKSNARSYGYKLWFWGRPIALHGLVRFLNTTGPSLT